jgi:hypothetical protein
VAENHALGVVLVPALVDLGLDTCGRTGAERGGIALANGRTRDDDRRGNTALGQRGVEDRGLPSAQVGEDVVVRGAV